MFPFNKNHVRGDTSIDRATEGAGQPDAGSHAQASIRIARLELAVAELLLKNERLRQQLIGGVPALRDHD